MKEKCNLTYFNLFFTKLSLFLFLQHLSSNFLTTKISTKIVLYNVIKSYSVDKLTTFFLYLWFSPTYKIGLIECNMLEHIIYIKAVKVSFSYDKACRSYFWWQKLYIYIYIVRFLEKYILIILFLFQEISSDICTSQDFISSKVY